MNSSYKDDHTSIILHNLTTSIRYCMIMVCCCFSSYSFSQANLFIDTLPSPTIVSISSFGLSEGLPNNCIHNTISDNQGRLWINLCEFAFEDQEIGFFQFDGKKSFFYSLEVDSLSSIEEKLNWYILGQTKKGYLFGLSTTQHTSIVFLFNPDTQKHYFFQFRPSEIILNLIEDPQDGIFALVREKDTSRIYHLDVQGKKEVIVEFKGNLNNKSNFLFSRSFIIQNQKAWFFIPFEGLAAYDLITREKYFYAFEDLLKESFQFEGINEIIIKQGVATISSLKSDEILLYIGPYHGFYTFHIPSSTVSSQQTLNQILDLQKNKSQLAVRVDIDNFKNLLITFGITGTPENDFQATERLHILMDEEGQFYNYSSLIDEMKDFAPYGRINNFADVFFSQDFKRQLRWTSFGGLVMADIQIESGGIKAYPITFGIRAMGVLDSNTLFFNTDSWDFKLNLQSGDYSRLVNENFKSTAFSSLFISEDQNLWMSADSIMLRYNLTNDKFESLNFGINGNKFIFINKEEILLFSNNGELFWCNLSNRKAAPFIHKGVPFSIASEVNDLYSSEEKMLWVAAKNGLWQIDLHNNQVSYFNSSNGLPDNHITSVHPGENGTLWLGTFSSGVFIFDPLTQNLQQIAKINGLSHNTVTGILADEEGNRWVGTYDGITVLSATGKVLFDISEEDGLIHNEFNRTSYVKFPDGRMAFGGVQGINVLDPVQLRKSFIENIPLHIFLTSITYFDKKDRKNKTHIGALNTKNPIKIPAANRFLNLDFAISEYVDLTKHTYSYRIIPKKAKRSTIEDFSWSNLGPASELNLNNLPVGDYIIQIQGIDHKGQRTVTPLEIIIHVEEFFYRTWWFYVICALPFLFGGWLWLRRILTERKRLQVLVEKRTEQIQKDKEVIEKQAQELRSLDETKSRFFTNISHELRTPLTVISGMADKINQNPNQWLTKGTKMIRRNTDELLNLVNQILDLRKLEAGKLEPKLIQGNIIPFINYISESFHSFGAGKGIQMQFEPQKEELIMDYDPEIILRITSNLLSNAIKYSEKGGKVLLKLAKVPSPSGLSQEIQECLLLSVQDEGVGISQNELPHIFNRFYQVDDSTTRKGEGTGIGLSLTQELIKLLGGTIEVQSKKGIGSTFMVHLPIQRLAPFATRNAFPVSIPKPASIQLDKEILNSTPLASKDDLPELLIIEDNADVRQYLTVCLEGLYQLSYAVDGEAGIVKALEEVPDIIISDVMMPKKDGFEVCNTLKRDIRTSHIPIIMLTAKSDADSKIDGLQQGADAYLSKPFNEKELLVRLEKLLELRKTLQERYQLLIGKTALDQPISQQEDTFIFELQGILQQNLADETFGITELCRAIRMSRTQLHNKLKALTGQSTSHYIRSIRLHEAKERLAKQPDLNITQVAFETGFSNPTYFSRIFAEEMGISPSQYRKNALSEQ